MSENGARESITVTDNRTGQSYEMAVTDGTVKAMDFRKIKTANDDFGLMVYDPAFTNTASCRSAITQIDGDRGILEYRGYPIEQLAEQSTYLETAYLLLYGELPNKKQLKEWTEVVRIHTYIHENAKKFMEGFQYGPPDGCSAGLSLLCHSIGRQRLEDCHIQAVRLIAQDALSRSPIV
jgi:citrate synthase